MSSPPKKLVILGTRGIPAAHGGFETFAEKLSLYLVDRGWSVTVYCQEEGAGKPYRSNWHSVDRVHIPVATAGSLGSIFFDLKAVLASRKDQALILTLGYNTAIFSTLHRLFGDPNVINMDGIEWRRQKWGRLTRAWFRVNEWIACRVGQHLVADNPGIEDHLAQGVRRDRITMIPYGADRILEADTAPLAELDLAPAGYAIVVARAEPENSILEIVEAFSRRPRGIRLLVLGHFDGDANPYHARVLGAASKEVHFPGPIYDSDKLGALRFHALCYLHGHQVGGTNPSLVEALGAGNPVVAHDNHFNRWVAGDAARYFHDSDSAAVVFDQLLEDRTQLQLLADAARARFESHFQWTDVLAQYERLLEQFTPET